MAKIFKALSNEQRLKIFLMIQENEKEPDCCDGIQKIFSKACGCMNLSKSTISHHLKELQNAGVITCNRQGQILCSSINHDSVKEVIDFLTSEDD